MECVRSELSTQIVVQLLSCAWHFAIPWTAAHETFLSFTASQSLLKFVFIESVMLSNHLICCCSLFLTSIFPSIRVFSSESALPISFSISPSNEYWELIIFRIDSFDLFAVQGTLRSLLQHYSSKASFLHCSAFFLIQLSHHTWLLERPYLWLYGPLSAKWVYGRENTSLYVCIEEREHGFMREHIK